ncbi:hypothetical protein SAMN05192546_11099 [Tindallia californiensis]|uniref:Homeodomain-like domain-containing protein n=1 Tax=Tindallia californiensis TaxID=159292 RepID=A0A1H3QUS1_9FIRM|nr:hypothetical protein SAMN05192546_11099 [Tindallia californiensis]
MIVDADIYVRIRHMHTQEGIGQRKIARRLGISSERCLLFYIWIYCLFPCFYSIASPQIFQ